MKKYLPFIIFAGLVGFISVKSILNKISFTVNGIAFDNSASLVTGYNSLVFNVDVSGKNDSDFNLSMQNINIDLLYASSKIAKVNSLSSFILPQKSSTLQKIKVIVPVNSIIPAVKSLFSDLQAGKAIEISYNGFASIKYLGKIPLSGKTIIA